MIAPGEKVIEKKICRISGKEFFVTDRDMEFYDRVSPVIGGNKYAIPSPNLCPEERMRRRLIFLNNRHFYNMKSSRSGKNILSIFAEDKGYPVYHFDEWYAQDWDACDFGRKMDMGKTVTNNYAELLKVFPKRNIVLGNGSENCEYVCNVGGSKNCYLITDTSGAVDCYFSSKVDGCEKCIDCSFCMQCMICYECLQSENCYSCLYAENCSDCRDCIGISDCKNCTDCMLSSNLINKRFVFLNKQLSESEYRSQKQKFVESMSLGRVRTKDISRNIPHDFAPHLHESNNECCLGDYVNNCSNCYECFSCSECSNCKYCTGLIHDANNCMDIDGVGNHIEDIYESLTINKNCSSIIFTNDAWGGCKDVMYSTVVKNSKNIFLSTGIVGKENCILNTPYSVQEYETLCEKIISHMMSTGEWGEFFAPELSPFGYNETVANEYFPMAEAEVKSHGWNWYNEPEKKFEGNTIIPLPIREYDEKVVGFEAAQRNIDILLNGVIKCEISGKPCKIIKQELAFYIENHLPIPTKHPNQRHIERMNLRNPRFLNERSCSNCQNTMVTSYQANTAEKVVCETCYRKLVY